MPGTCTIKISVKLLRYVSSSVTLSSQFNIIHFSHSVMSDSLQPHRLQNARLLCPSPTPGPYSNSYALNQ